MTVLRTYQVRFLGDPSLAFTKALDLSFDGASIFGGDRSKRYALVIEDGAVKEAHVESDNTGLNGAFPARGVKCIAVTNDLQSPLQRRYSERPKIRTYGEKWIRVCDLVLQSEHDSP